MFQDKAASVDRVNHLILSHLGLICAWVNKLRSLIILFHHLKKLFCIEKDPWSIMIYIFLPFFNMLRLLSELHANGKPQATQTSVITMSRILFILLGFFRGFIIVRQKY